VELHARLPKELLRFSTAGSVDDGKSTFIGRLLYDTGNIYDDHVEALKATAERKGEKKLPLALVTDGLRAEREQGITIDVAYRYFSTEKRRFILADSPGHEQYTRNMATAASTADLTVVLVDARLGILPQTKRHAFVAALLGVPRLLIAINKMDLVEYSEERFNELVEGFRPFIDKLGVREVRFVPVVAVDGDNIVRSSDAMPWYQGETVLKYLEDVYIGADVNRVDLRFPVQYVLRHHDQYRGYAGTIESGTLRVGEEVVALPSERAATVTAILLHGRENVAECSAGDAVAISLSKEIDIARGSMLVRTHNIPRISSHFNAMVVWCSEEPLSSGARLIVRHTTQEVRARISDIEYVIDVHDLHRKTKATLELNDIARVSLQCQTPLFLDSYQRNRATGSFIIIDALTNKTVAAGMVLDRESLHGAEFLRRYGEERAADLHPPTTTVSREIRRQVWGAPPITLWLTGLSGAGKSTIGQGLEAHLMSSGTGIVWLDGDALRSGLNADLGFSRRDRSEHIRRTAEVAKLLNASGALVVCSLISPGADQRALARQIVGEDSFYEVYVNASLAACEKRDPHGLYARARSGDLAQFTGVDSAYEPPLSPHIVLDTENNSVERCVQQLLDFLRALSDKQSQ
jgi:bifunctional enzyme CysN/CysC